MNEAIVAALEQLDVDNPEHWTSDGLPRVDVVSELLGEDVTRKQITEAAPQFTQSNPTTELPPVEEPPTEDEPEEEEPPTEDDEALVAAVDDELVVQLDELDDRIAELKAEKEALRKKEESLMSERDAVITEIEKRRPKSSNQDEIVRYLNGQKKLREARGRRLVSLKEQQSGPVMAPIDAAMRRNRARGTQRPQRNARLDRS